MKKIGKSNNILPPRTDFKKIFISALLFLIGTAAVLYQIISTDISPTILSQNFKSVDANINLDQEILQGEKVRGTVTANENNLGILYVRFNTFGRVNEDKITFRIKEQNSYSWHFESEYDARIFSVSSGSLYPFGFPIINNSRGKIFQFELESRSGTTGNAVALSSIKPVAVAKYKYNKAEILKTSKNFINFLVKRTKNAFTNDNLLLVIIVSFLPFSLYVSSFTKSHSVLENSFFTAANPLVSSFFKPANLLFMILIIIDIFFIPQVNDLFNFIIIIVWQFYSFFIIKRGKAGLIFALLLIMLCPILIELHMAEKAEKAAIWIYLLMITGVIQAYIENRSSI